MVASTVETIYKIGDRVKLRKKPIAASHLKRGDVVTVAAVHPSNGSIKFWNEQSKRWEFAYPEEIGRILDSVTPDEVAVTESTPAPGNHDSVTPVEVAVTESTPAEGEYLALNAISTYRPRGTARGGEYYRLSYKEGSRVKHVHIRGGNTDSPIAQAKVAEVRSLLVAGLAPAEIATMLKTPPKL
jgi:hypothetical protein